MNLKKKVDTSFKEKRNVIEFDLKNISVKKHKEKKLAFRLKSIIFVKKIFCL